MLLSGFTNVSEAASIIFGPGALVMPGTTYSSSFVLNGVDGFDSNAHEVTKASALFFVSDFSGGGLASSPETVTIELEGSFFASAQNYIGFLTLGGAIGNLAMLGDGVLGYSITAGDSTGEIPVTLNLAQLVFEFGDKTQPVPDGGSMMALLGLSVLGLGWASRRVRA